MQKSAIDYAIWYLSRYPKSEEEIRIILFTKWYNSEEVAHCLDVLKKNDFINDEKSKNDLLTSLLKRNPGQYTEYEGVVKSMTSYGAFVDIGGADGMIHISKLSKEHVDKVEDVVKVGDRVLVKTIKIDERGRVDMRLEKKL